MSDINDIKLTGTLISKPYKSHTFHDEDIFTLIIRVNRNYRTLDIYDDIKVYLTATQEDINNLVVGDKYKLEGYLVQSKILGKPTVAVATDNLIKVDNDTIDNNELHVTGRLITLSHIRTNSLGNNYMRLILENISDKNNGDRITLRLTTLNKTTTFAHNNLAKGNLVDIKGTLESDRIQFITDKNGDKIHQLLSKVNYILKISD